MTTAIVRSRHALGLPAGSVRALLALMVLGLFLAFVLVPQEPRPKIPLYLYSLVFLILGHFFAAHGHSIAGPTAGGQSPLHLPRGTLRTLILVAFLGVLGWHYYTHHDLGELQPDLDQPWIPVVILAAFFVGILINRIASLVFRGPTGLPFWYQDILAWVSLLAVIGLAGEVAIQFFINPTLPPERQLNLPTWQGILSAVVAFYFGVRS
jgi:hypothetical protein